jgi:hypothetical protein
MRAFRNALEQQVPSETAWMEQMDGRRRTGRPRVHDVSARRERGVLGPACRSGGGLGSWLVPTSTSTRETLLARRAMAANYWTSSHQSVDWHDAWILTQRRCLSEQQALGR